MIEIIGPAFLLLFVLAGIHAFFGLEIIRRGVIFADLAIGQTAALGVAVSLAFFGGDLQYPLTLLFALAAALLVAYATRRIQHLEAFIGLLYAFGASGIMVVLAQSAEGAEVFKRLLAADILFTPIHKTLKAALLYGTIALVLLFVYPRTKGFAREALFFGLFALTVTSSVQLGGILVVFILLIAPALMALNQKRFAKLPFAWISGTLFGTAGIVLSYFLDLPTGYSVIFCISLAAMAFLAMDSLKR